MDEEGVIEGWAIKSRGPAQIVWTDVGLKSFIELDEGE